MQARAPNAAPTASVAAMAPPASSCFVVSLFLGMVSPSFTFMSRPTYNGSPGGGFLDAPSRCRWSSAVQPIIHGLRLVPIVDANRAVLFFQSKNHGRAAIHA